MKKSIGRYTNRSSLNTKRKTLRKEATPAERKFWKYIRAEQMGGCKFRRQYSIGSYIVDFYCHQLKLVVELDGWVHGEERVKQKDIIRQRWIEKQGYTVKRYTNEQIKYDIDGVLQDTINTLRAQRTPPRLP